MQPTLGVIVMLGFEGGGEPCRSGIITAGLAKIRNMISFESGQLLFTFADTSGWDNEELPAFNTTQRRVKLLTGTIFTRIFFLFQSKEIKFNQHKQTTSHLSLIGIQSFAVAANFTVKVPKLLCQAHRLMAARSFGLIFSELFF